MGFTCPLRPQVHRMTGIPETNLRLWQCMIAEDPEWCLWHTHHEERRRIFSQFEEVLMVSFILNNFVSGQLIFTDSNFQEVAVSAFFHKYHQSEDEPPSGAHQFYQFVQVAG
jgi:hypothetical protein